MSTVIRPELSQKNPYWIEKHRYYELKHFCLQYPIWKKAYASLSSLAKRPDDLSLFLSPTRTSDPTAKCAESMLYYSERMELIEKAIRETDEEFASYLLEAVAYGYSYNSLKARLNIPCCKETFYGLYRKFFYILNKMRS